MSTIETGPKYSAVYFKDSNCIEFSPDKFVVYRRINPYVDLIYIPPEDIFYESTLIGFKISHIDLMCKDDIEIDIFKDKCTVIGHNLNAGCSKDAVSNMLSCLICENIKITQ